MNEETSPEQAPTGDPYLAGSDPSSTGQELAELREALASARAEAERFRDEALRARADTDNARKRAQRDVEAAHKYGVERLVEALIPVQDSMELGLEAAQSATDIGSLQEGMALTRQMFQAALEKMSVVAIDPTGQRFDPEKHQAIMAEASTTAEPETVLRVLQKGYTLHDRVIRPAMVVVAKGPNGT